MARILFYLMAGSTREPEQELKEGGKYDEKNSMVINSNRSNFVNVDYDNHCVSAMGPPLSHERARSSGNRIPERISVWYA